MQQLNNMLPKVRTALLLSLTVFFSCSTSTQIKPKEESNKITVKKGQTAKSKGKEYILFENIYVTGNETYSLKRVEEGLELDKHLRGIEKEEKIISIGEGLSQLVEVGLRKNRGYRNSYSLDPIYGEKNFPDNKAGNELKAFLHRNKAFLLPYYSDNTKQKDNEYALVLSHMLVNNFMYHKGKFAADSSMVELYRITKKGGKIVVLGFQIYDKIKKFGKTNGVDWTHPKHSWQKKELHDHYKKMFPDATISEKESATTPFLYLLSIFKKN